MSILVKLLYFEVFCYSSLAYTLMNTLHESNKTTLLKLSKSYVGVMINHFIIYQRQMIKQQIEMKRQTAELRNQIKYQNNIPAELIIRKLKRILRRWVRI